MTAEPVVNCNVVCIRHSRGRGSPGQRTSRADRRGPAASPGYARLQCSLRERLSILAAEKAAQRLSDVDSIDRVTVEVYERAKRGMGTGEHHWNPDSRETADHSIPYVVAASLIDRRLTPASFDDARLWDPRLRALLPKIVVVANEQFTAAYERLPVQHCARVTVRLRNGERLVGEAGGDRGDLSQPKSDADIAGKFRDLTQGVLGRTRVDAALDVLWRLESLSDAAEIPRLLVFA
jgi:2-methylcitrate dehydratase